MPTPDRWFAARAALRRYRAHPKEWCKAKGHRPGPFHKPDPKDRREVLSRCLRCSGWTWPPERQVRFFNKKLKQTYSRRYFKAFESRQSPLYRYLGR